MLNVLSCSRTFIHVIHINLNAPCLIVCGHGLDAADLSSLVHVFKYVRVRTWLCVLILDAYPSSQCQKSPDWQILGPPGEVNKNARSGENLPLLQRHQAKPLSANELVR